MAAALVASNNSRVLRINLNIKKEFQRDVCLQIDEEMMSQLLQMQIPAVGSAIYIARWPVRS